MIKIIFLVITLSACTETNVYIIESDITITPDIQVGAPHE